MLYSLSLCACVRARARVRVSSPTPMQPFYPSHHVMLPLHINWPFCWKLSHSSVCCLHLSPYMCPLISSLFEPIHHLPLLLFLGVRYCFVPLIEMIYIYLI